MSADNYHLQRVEHKTHGKNNDRRLMVRTLRGTPNVFLKELDDGSANWELWRYGQIGGKITTHLGDMVKQIQHFDDCEALYEAAFEEWLKIVCEMFGFKMNYVHLEVIWAENDE